MNLIHNINSIKFQEDTDIGFGLESAVKEFPDRKGKTEKILILLSDEEIDLSFHADPLLYVARCTVNSETGEMYPIEDHILALEAISQIFAGSGIRHTTTGTPKAPSASYDDSVLVAQEKAEAEN